GVGVAVGVTFLLVGDRRIVLAVMQIHIRIAHVARLSNFVISPVCAGAHEPKSPRHCRSVPFWVVVTSGGPNSAYRPLLIVRPGSSVVPASCPGGMIGGWRRGWRRW